MKHLLLLSLLVLTKLFLAQNVGINQSNPTNTLHITPVTIGNNPLRVDGLQAYSLIDGDTSLLIINPTTGIVKYINPSDFISLLGNTNGSDSQDLDSLILDGLTLSAFIQNGDSTSVNLSPLYDSILSTIINNSDTLFSNTAFTDSIISIINNNTDTLFSNSTFIDSLLSVIYNNGDTLLYNSTFVNNLRDSIDTDVDSVTLNGYTLSIYENGNVVTTDLSSLSDSALANLINNSDTLFSNTAFTDSIISIINNNTDTLFSNTTFIDSLISVIYNNGDTLLYNSTFVNNLRDSIDTDVDSVTLNGYTLSIYENGNVVTTDLSSLSDSAFANLINNSDTLFSNTVFTDSIISIINNNTDTLFSNTTFIDSLLSVIYNNGDTLLYNSTFVNNLRDSIDTDEQTLTLIGDTLSISNGNNITLGDNNPTNEYNVGLNLIGTTLTILDGGGGLSVDLDTLINDNDWDVNANGTGLEASASGRNVANGIYSIAAGDSNQVFGNYGVIAGGIYNKIEHQTRYSSYGGVISGGKTNLIEADWFSSIGGGVDNFIGGGSDGSSGRYGTIGGGNNNRINQGQNATIAGGVNNAINSGYASIVGGNLNNITGNGSFIGGGSRNLATGTRSVISGGQQNKTASNNSTVSGGNSNTASGSMSTVSGGEGNSSMSYGEWTGGLFSTEYTPSNRYSWKATDRIFNVGNGLDTNDRSNAFTILKNGKITINDAYTLPNIDGATNQVLATNGSGIVNWVNTDISSTNELNTGANLTGSNLNIIDAGGTKTVNLTPITDRLLETKFAAFYKDTLIYANSHSPLFRASNSEITSTFSGNGGVDNSVFIYMTQGSWNISFTVYVEIENTTVAPILLSSNGAYIYSSIQEQYLDGTFSVSGWNTDAKAYEKYTLQTMNNEEDETLAPGEKKTLTISRTYNYTVVPNVSKAYVHLWQQSGNGDISFKVLPGSTLNAIRTF